MYFRGEFKLCVLWMLLLLQVLLVVFYLLVAPSNLASEYSTAPPKESSKPYAIKFVASSSMKILSKKTEWQGYNNRINLRNADTTADNYFTKLNNETECFLLGTDLAYSKKLLSLGEAKCECKRGWHGKDCGQPEVIWRAFIASRQKIIPRRRNKLRRIIHAFPLLGVETTLAEIKLQELSDVVDCFLVGESNLTATGENKPLYFHKRLHDKNFLPKSILKKLLYVPFLDLQRNFNKISNHSDEYSKTLRHLLWEKGRTLIDDLGPDDLYVDAVDAYEIPNPKALLFFKLYNGWPQPITFRLRWSVYGFFWQHPKRTITAPGASTIGMLARTYPSWLANTEDLLSGSYGLVVGDLNHYGGWYCSWCLEPRDIVAMLQWTPRGSSPVDWDKVGSKKTVDVSYVEDLVGTGLWLDGATALVRKSPYRDQYFAPEHVINNTWKYDFLYTNFYSKMDYYN